MLTCVFSILLSQQAANPPSEKASAAQRDQRKTSSWVSHPTSLLGVNHHCSLLPRRLIQSTLWVLILILPKALRTRAGVNGFLFRESRSRLISDAGFLEDQQAF